MGPGELFARRFATDGAAVVITDINEAGAHETIRQIENRWTGRILSGGCPGRRPGAQIDRVCGGDLRLCGRPGQITHRRPPMSTISSSIGGKLSRHTLSGPCTAFEPRSMPCAARSPATRTGLRCRQGRHPPADDRVGLAGGEGEHPSELPGARLDRIRTGAQLLGAVDSRRAHRARCSVAAAVVGPGCGCGRASGDRRVAARARNVMVWWSEDEPRLIPWGDVGYAELI